MTKTNTQSLFLIDRKDLSQECKVCLVAFIPQLHSCYAHGLFTWVEAVWCVMLARDQEIIELISSQVRRHIRLPK